jgi:hypothetical protein
LIAILRDLGESPGTHGLRRSNQNGKNLIPDISGQKVHKDQDLKVLTNGYLTLMNLKVLGPGDLPIQRTSTFTHLSQMILIHEEFIQMILTLVAVGPQMVMIPGDPQEKVSILGCHIQKTLILEVHLDQMVSTAGGVDQDQNSFLLVEISALEE